MKKIDKDTILGKIEQISELQEIKDSDLLLGEESVLDLVLQMPNSEEKFGLFADLTLLNVDKGRTDVFFMRQLLDMNNGEIIQSVIDKNKNENGFSLAILKAAFEHGTMKDINNLVCKNFSDGVVENANILLKHVLMQPYIDERDNDKIFVLLLANDRMTDKLDNEFIIKNVAKNASPKILKLLLSSQMDLNQPDLNNENALFFVDGKSEEEIKKKVGLLVESGIDKEIKNINGLTAFEANRNIRSLNEYGVKKEVKRVRPSF